MTKKTFLLAAAVLALPFSASFAMAQDNGSRAYMNLSNSDNQVGGFAGPVKNASGIVLGKISPVGDITDAAEDNLGKVTAQGTVTAPDGKKIGNVSPGDRLGAYNMAKKASLSH